MVKDVAYSEEFKNKIRKIDPILKVKVKKQIKKIINNPNVGKPIRYTRKGTRELYILLHLDCPINMIRQKTL